jgi:hypothetical protein
MDLVLAFHEAVHSQSRWDRQTVPAPIADKGPADSAALIKVCDVWSSLSASSGCQHAASQLVDPLSPKSGSFVCGRL